MDDNIRSQLERVQERFDGLTAEMGRPEVAADYEQLNAIARERAGMNAIVELFAAYRAAEDEALSATAMLEGESDAEMREFAQSEADTARERMTEIDQQIVRALLPSDPRDAKNVIVEIRAGAGGEEAALFAADLYRMYVRYAERRRWQTEIIDASESERGGFKEIVFEVRGDGAYSRLKFESGVHRVQRVPTTEAQGRIHTSTATVAVLAEVDDVDVDVEEKDIRTDIFHSSGAGGQNVNKVATAVRLTHLPTGIVVVCQDERSQMKNRVKAMTVLKARLFDLEMQKQQDETAAARRSQVGSGDRSEKIRTYNFPQDRITDHRINLTVHSMPERLDGNIDDLIDAIANADEAERLQGVAG